MTVRGKEDSLVLHTVSECCMCGDLGLSCEIFICIVCHFRSQHRYCSNLYPKAASYDVCNWCLIQDSKEKPLQNSISLSSSANRNYFKDVTGLSKKIKKIEGEIKKEASRNCTVSVTNLKKSSSDHHLRAKGIIFKKESSRNCNGLATNMKKSSSDHQWQAKGIIFEKEGRRNCNGLVTNMKKSSSDHQLQAKGIIFEKESRRNCNGLMTNMKKSCSDHHLQAKGIIFEKESRRNCNGLVTNMKKSCSDHQLQAKGIDFRKESSRNCNGLVTSMKKSCCDHQLQAKGIEFKKESVPIRKRIFTKGQLEEMIKLRRTKSEEMMPNDTLPKYSFRNKVRRYKLLDEVSS